MYHGSGPKGRSSHCFFYFPLFSLSVLLGTSVGTFYYYCCTCLQCNFNVLVLEMYVSLYFRCVHVCSSKSIIYRYMVIVYYSCDRQIQNSDAAIIASLNFTEKYHNHRIPTRLKNCFISCTIVWKTFLKSFA